MSLGPDVADRQHGILHDFSLDTEVELLRVLRLEFGLQLSEHENGTEDRPIKWNATRGIQDAAEGIRKHAAASDLARDRATLKSKRSVEEAFADGRAAAEGRLGLELLQHQLFDRIVENSEPATNRHLAISLRIPCDSKARRERFVVRLGQALRNSGVSGDHETHGTISVRRDAAVVNRAGLSRTERLIAATSIVERLVVFPAQ